MGLFKSKDERRIEREMKIKAGLRSIERAIRQQEKFAEEFIGSARQARKIGDQNQYAFIRNSLKRTAAVKKMLERQLLAMKSAMLIQQQARASQHFADSMRTLATDIGKAFGETDLTRTQADWERAVAQASTLDERMDLFLTSMESGAVASGSVGAADAVTDDEVDRLIDADVLAAEHAELSKLDELEGEIAKELGQKQRD
jgi:uncharacterized membrane protein YccC